MNYREIYDLLKNLRVPPQVSKRLISQLHTKALLHEAKGREIIISETLTLIEVRSLTLLNKVGRQLSLSVRDIEEARYHIDCVLAKSEELWFVILNSKIAGLIQISLGKGLLKRDKENYRTLEECDAANEEPLYIGRRNALRVLERLRISHVDARSFNEIGAFPMFLKEDVDPSLPDPIFEGSELHFVWMTEDTIAIATVEEERYRTETVSLEEMKWSCLHMDMEDSWMDLGSMDSYFDIGKAFHLLLRSPNFYRAVSKFEESKNH